MENRDILFVVYKATSELDFIIPLIWKIKKEQPDYNVSLFYAVLNKKMILRKSKFYSSVARKSGVKEYDLSDFLFFPLNICKPLLKMMFSFSYWDITDKRYRGTTITNRFMRKIITLFRKMLRVLDKGASLFVNYSALFKELHPDTIFFPPREYKFSGKKHFYRYTYKNKTRVILYPHSPFPSTGRYSIQYGDVSKNNGRVMPEFCEYWYSFKEELTPKDYPELKNQFFYTGYPGLDSEWYEYLRKRNKSNKKGLKCLFIARRFVPEVPNDGTSDYILEKEFLEMINATIDSLKKTGENIELVIKPHPQNDYKSIENIMRQTDYENWRVTYETIYEEIADTDFVVSIHSGIVTVPYVFGIPVILLNSTAKGLFEKWGVIKEMFADVQFYVDDLKKMPIVLGNVVMHLLGQNGDELLESKVGEDIKKIRNYFVDDSLGRVLNRLMRGKQ